MDFRRDGLGAALVALQMGLIGWLAWLALNALVAGDLSPVAWLLGAVGFTIGGWSLFANRPGNFNVMPTPKLHGHLVTSGPYRWIRHPMYTAVMFMALACAVTAGSLLAWLVAAALGVVLGLKSSLEERWMIAQHPAYEAYRTRTDRFFPGLF